MKSLYKTLATGIAGLMTYTSVGITNPTIARAFESPDYSDYVAQNSGASIQDCFKLYKVVDEVQLVKAGDEVPDTQRGKNITVVTVSPNTYHILDQVNEDFSSARIRGAYEFLIPCFAQFGPEPKLKIRGESGYQTFSEHQRPGTIDPDNPRGEPKEIIHSGIACYKAVFDDKNLPKDTNGEYSEYINIADNVGERRLSKARARGLCFKASFTLAKNLEESLYGINNHIKRVAVDPNEPQNEATIYQTGTVSDVRENSSNTHCFLYLGNSIGCSDPDGEGPLNVGDGQLSSPTGISITPNGNRIVADSLNHRLVQFDKDNIFKRNLGTPGDQKGQFSSLIPGIVYDSPNQRIIASDNGNNRIQAIPEDWSGNPTEILEANVVDPRGLTIGNGKIWVTSQSQGRIFTFDQTNLGSLESIILDNARDIAIDTQRNRVYITDESESIKILSATSPYNLIGTLTSESNPNSATGSINLDEEGNILLHDVGNSYFYIFGPNGNQKLVSGGEGSAIGAISSGDAPLTRDPSSKRIVMVDSKPRIVDFIYNDALEQQDPNTP